MKKPHICILATQYFGWGAYSGFGSMPRKLARALVAEGFPVTVLTQRRKGQRATEEIDGVVVRTYGGLDVRELAQAVRGCDAQIFHSQNPSLVTYLAQKLKPDAAHLITCRDPHSLTDWAIEFRYATMRRRLLLAHNYANESSFLVQRAVRRAQAVFCTAEFARPKVQSMFKLRDLPGFLPNLTAVPDRFPEKSERPTFVFVARWDKRKRPELFLDLAKQFPHYRFIAAGASTSLGESGYDRSLRRRYEGLSNLEMPGIVNQFETPERFTRLLSEAWVLVNTAARESLPLTFTEAAAHGCALLSAVDPDQWVSRFGEHVQGDDFASGVRTLMESPPLAKGRAAYDYVRQSSYEHTRALTEHIKVYQQYA